MRTIMLAAATALALLVPSAAALDLATPATEVSRWIVGFHEMPELEVGDDYNGARVVSTTPELRFVTIETTSFALFQARATLDENVRYVETDVSDHKLFYTPNDYFTNHVANYGYWKIGADKAHDKTLGSTAIKNGHVDSGMNFAHEDLQGSRFVKGYDFYAGDTNPEDGRGCSWHGTHTTGTAAATINNGKGFPGLSQSTVVVAKIFGGGGCRAATVTGIANALKFVGDQGSHVSSNSWGGGSYSSAINDAILYSFNKGVIFVAAAGNDGCSNCIGNPWKPVADKVIIVTATDINDAGASFNSKGPEVDVSAPGVDIGSSTSGTADYHYMSGTSMAAPHVTGVVLLIKTLNPSMTYSQVDSRLKSTAVDLGPAGHDSTFGYGRINAAAAVY
ncbi:MAG TPA: S8 family serine peptidase [Candidatus Thermoplasmatota archaeon]|nr:S8 family serine peptidase [Candidatus Thermoplasmatota archaeon]